MITVLYTYFGQRERIQGIVNQGLKTVIIDDCSKEPLGFVDGIRVARITDDIKWNQPGARNLGFHICEGWILCVDIDHLVTKENMEQLNNTNLRKGCVYYLGREDTKSINVYVIHKDDFEKIGGYDEDFCGNYGYDDIHFYNKCKKFLEVHELKHIKTKVYAKESSSEGVRDGNYNSELIKKKDVEKIIRTKKRLRFNWEYVN
jgi:hypothetical protein